VTEAPAYLRIKNWLLSRIEAGEWREGDRIPSEPELARRFKVARMTVNRAVRELAAVHLLVRTPGSGTFVAPPRHEATLVEIRTIADEIRRGGGVHSTDVKGIAEVRADKALAAELGVAEGEPLFHTVLLHRADGIPAQLEERWVVPSAAPEYLAQDFVAITPSEYLMRVAPLARVDYRIEARLPDESTRAALALAPGAPCLLLHRCSYSRGRAASSANLWYPGNRYRLTGHV
jgi:GntR family histidine utilization transcriptional repressor